MIHALIRALRRLGFHLRRGRYESELNEEIEFHLAQLAEDYRREGYSGEEALRLARLRFGNRGVVQEDARAVWAVRSWDALRRDTRITLRGLRRAPVFTAMTLATLGLGIGGTTAIFTLIHGALLAPLPYPDPERLVNVHITVPESGGQMLMPWSFPKFAAMRDLVRSFDGIAGFNATNANLRGDETLERVVIEEVSADYFGMLGATTVLGRAFTRAEDSVPNGSPVVVLSHGLWQRRFGRDSSLLGKPISIGGSPFTVIGVLAPGFRALSGPVDLWAPLAMSPTLEYPEALEERWSHWIGVVARVRPGVTQEAATAEVAVVGRRVDDRLRSPRQKDSWSATVALLDDLRLDPAVRRATVVLFVAVGFVLLIACANVASLLLVRSTSRRREMAIRSAVGAGRGALTRQLLVESSILGITGGLLGLALASWGARALARSSPKSPEAPAGLTYLFDVHDVGLSGPVVLFAIGLSLLTGLTVGLLPARQASRSSLVSGLRGEATGGRSPGRRHWRAQHGLIGLEAALAIVLVVGAGLMIRSFGRLAGLDLGFDGDRVLTFAIAPAERDRAATEPARFKAAALDALAAIKGVEAAGVNNCAPLTANCNGSVVTIVDSEHLKDDAAPPIGVHYASRGYFEALKIPLVSGRLFGPEDRPRAPRVVIVNRAAANRFWPGEDPIGKKLSIAMGYFAGGDSIATVIGVVGDVRFGRPEQAPELDAYVPALQMSYGRTMFFLRTASDPLGLADAARAAIRSQDPGVPIFAVRTMNEISAVATARTRFLTVLLAVFSAVALTLAAVGVYGVIAFAVSSRAKEISVRLAVGADGPRVVGMMVRQGAVPILLGVAVGVLAALGMTRLMSGLLYGIEATDPVSFGLAVLTLVVVGLVASWVPARRAARLEPLEALRADG